jgi:hypothetical protein
MEMEGHVFQKAKNKVRIISSCNLQDFNCILGSLGGISRICSETDSSCPRDE